MISQIKAAQGDPAEMARVSTRYGLSQDKYKLLAPIFEDEPQIILT